MQFLGLISIAFCGYGLGLGLSVLQGNTNSQYYCVGRTWPRDQAPKIFLVAGLLLLVGAGLIALDQKIQSELRWDDPALSNWFWILDRLWIILPVTAFTIVIVFIGGPELLNHHEKRKPI